MNTPQKRSNYTKFDNMGDANDYTRLNDRDVANIVQYLSDVKGVTQDVTISGTTLTIVNGVITKVV